MNKDITTYPLNTLPSLLKELGQPAFRSKQLVKWLYSAGATSYEQMTNLPLSLREGLSSRYPFQAPHVLDKQISTDGTRKYVIQFADGICVETVGIPSNFLKTNGSPKHLTVCFSTQAGCAMACAFCATGQEGLSRNLSAGEMILQVLTVAKDFDCRVTNLVSMGQGEPFQNYDATIEALRYMNSADGLEIGARHITVSTCGITSGIEKLGHEPEQFTLALSLHSALQEVRDQLMPRCANIPLPQLKDCLLDYIQHSGRRVTLEYILIDNVNDRAEDLRALLDFTHRMKCHINLIPINSVENSKFQPSTHSTVRFWRDSLNNAGRETTVRDSRGADIDGACGQLKNKLQK